jgi:indolepyruvate decarboxylase
MGRDFPQRAIEKADCVLILGAFMTDINLGIYTAKLDPSRTIYARSQTISIKHHHYEDVFLGHFIAELAKADLGPRHKFSPTRVGKTKPYKPRPKHAITVARFFDRMNSFLGDSTIVICDIGDSLFGASDLTIHKRTEFISPAYYTSMGFAVPAAVGTQIRERNLRPVVFVGDGAFQMTGHELSTVARHGLNPIVFVLNNKGYTTERFIHEGDYNDIPNWAYHLWPQIVGQGWGTEVRTEGELEIALSTARANQSSFSIINVHLDPMDCSDALVRLGKRLGKKVK